MATVLITWELGLGSGHLTTLLPIVKALSERGHRVAAALRDLPRAAKVLAAIRLSYFQAPTRPRTVDDQISPPRTFAHILHNIGFGDFDELRVMAEAWRNLYECVQPDLIVFDHSPTALLAARGRGAKRALVGAGFFCPQDTYPFPDLRPWLGDDSERLRHDEDRVLENVNRVLNAWGEAPLERLSQLYAQVEENFLTTFRELDVYPDRKAARYWGAWPNLGGKTPLWPQHEGKKLYAYLKPFPALPSLLAVLNELRCPTLVYVDGIDGRLQSRFRSATLRFEHERLDLRQVGEQCDLAILNGNHGTTVSMLLAGKPILQVPIYLEQGLNSTAVARLGAGLHAPPTQPQQIAVALKTLVHSESHAAAARRFAARYASFVPEQQISKTVRRVQALLY